MLMISMLLHFFITCHETTMAVQLLNAVTVAIHGYLNLLFHLQQSTACRWGRSWLGIRSPCQ
jgi:hypothetical protein